MSELELASATRCCPNMALHHGSIKDKHNNSDSYYSILEFRVRLLSYFSNNPGRHNCMNNMFSHYRKFASIKGYWALCTCPAIWLHTSTSLQLAKRSLCLSFGSIRLRLRPEAGHVVSC